MAQQPDFDPQRLKAQGWSDTDIAQLKKAYAARQAAQLQPSVPPNSAAAPTTQQQQPPPRSAWDFLKHLFVTGRLY